MFPFLSRDSSISLGIDLVDHIIAYLSSGYVYGEEAVSDNPNESVLSQREKDVVAYLAGYVFSTFCRWIFGFWLC